MNECVKLTVGLVIFFGMGKVVFVPFLEASTWDVSNLQLNERFKKQGNKSYLKYSLHYIE